ncbi:hypothetical protein NQ317_019425 [Molorchus minor]|uniref:Peptidase S1 domain-containing protein n=1 Tax=Molorchus minor TaxID=1323400 RepID=A0ABQ9J171_9CUCU|nr:hypothetical protein NQ317_019425 [Molorchus minor]
MQLLSACTFACLLSINTAYSERRERSGFPKFPLNTCGSRVVHWKPQRSPRIIGGQEPPLGAVPWQVELRLGDNHQCGGALISRRLILSAAHCYSEGLTAAVGTHGAPGVSPHEQVLKVEKFISHPDFRKLGPYSHDLALVLVSAPGFKMNDMVKPACFSEESASPGTWCEVSGWGATDPKIADRLSPVLKLQPFQLSPWRSAGRRVYTGEGNSTILDSMLCAGHLKGGIDACGGDSGGPLICERDGRLELTGIVSWGDGCAKKNRPGIYTRVSSFAPWIRESAIELGVDYEF